MILLSNGGTNIQRNNVASDTIAIGTVDGVALLAKSERSWRLKHRTLQGVFVSGVTALDDGTLFASTRGVGMARSDDGGDSWTWINDVPPVSKADFYKGLVRNRVKLANVDDIVASPTASQRWKEAADAL